VLLITEYLESIVNYYISVDEANSISQELFAFFLCTITQPQFSGFMKSRFYGILSKLATKGIKVELLKTWII